MAAGAAFPPLVVFQEGDRFWLAEGFHRHAAGLQADLSELPCKVRDGGLRDAILHSAGANSAHGLRRTNADKRRAVLMLLEDEEWSAWSDREIARRCAVSDRFVNGLRAELTAHIRSEPTPRTYQDRRGNVTQMDTARIGRRQAGQPEHVPAPPVPDALADALAQQLRQEAGQVRSRQSASTAISENEPASTNVPATREVIRSIVEAFKR